MCGHINNYFSAQWLAQFFAVAEILGTHIEANEEALSLYLRDASPEEAFYQLI
jgi:hypothetical protein